LNEPVFHDENGKWICTKCGACCKSKVGLDKGLPGYWDESKKSCKFLNDKNECEIYSDRPEICRTRWRPEINELMIKACGFIYSAKES
jgi:Fe-S-cluster containining protein